MRFRLGSCAATFIALTVFSVVSVRAQQHLLVEFSILDKHAVPGLDPRVDFLNAYGSLRLESRSTSDGTATNYYCGSDTEPRLTTDEGGGALTVSSHGSLCGFSLPDGMKVSPVPKIAFADEDNQFDVSFAGQLKKLHIGTIRVEGNEGHNTVVGYAFLEDNFAHREVFELDEHPDNALVVYLRSLYCGRVTVDDQLASQQPISEAVDPLVIDHASLFPLLVGRLDWQRRPGGESCG